MGNEHLLGPQRAALPEEDRERLLARWRAEGGADALAATRGCPASAETLTRALDGHALPAITRRALVAWLRRRQP
jgi:hypothetical protein